MRNSFGGKQMWFVRLAGVPHSGDNWPEFCRREPGEPPVIAGRSAVGGGQNSAGFCFILIATEAPAWARRALRQASGGIAPCPLLPAPCPETRLCT